MKEYVAKYITYDMAETWTGLPKFSATTLAVADQLSTAISYKTWKKAIDKTQVVLKG
ncbi:hypothetical protein C0993_000808, partial [Termitomyces sp. T159_Od127]